MSKKNIGSRAEVFHGVAEKTTGGLKKTDLVKNKHGYIVSLKKSKSMKNPKKNPLVKLGLLQKKGSKTFGPLGCKTKKATKSKGWLEKLFS